MKEHECFSELRLLHRKKRKAPKAPQLAQSGANLHKEAYTCKEVCERLGVSRNTVLDWIKLGKIKSFGSKGQGSKHRFAAKEVERLISGN